MTRPLNELIDDDEPAFDLVRKWISDSPVKCELLSPSPSREEALLRTQVTTRSPMGAVVYETGGILIDDGWVRFLGSGHSRLSRVLPEWNTGRAEGMLLVADDVVGGFFALNGGAFDGDLGSIYYWAPDSLEWEALDLSYSEILQALLSDRISSFYEGLRWESWRSDVGACGGDHCFSFYPFLWTREGSLASSSRSMIPVSEAFDLKTDIARQLED